jgi:hypothetical protein
MGNPTQANDPHAGKTLYWMTLLFVFVIAAAFFLHGLTYWVQVGWEREGSKAPSGSSEIDLLKAEHTNDLRTIAADKLILKSGLIINDGLVAKGPDPEDGVTRVFVKGLPFLKDKDLGKYTLLNRAGEKLKFLPGEVDRVMEGKGNPLAVPYETALKTFLGKHGN